MATKIKLRRDNSSVWQQHNPILFDGEPGYETDTGKLKIGNGTTPYNDLPYTYNTTGETNRPAWGDIVGPIAADQALTDALNSKELKSNKGRSSGYAPLDADGKVPVIHLPKLEWETPDLPIGKANGIAPLDENKKVPTANLPPFLTSTDLPVIGGQNGLVKLVDGKIPKTYLPTQQGGGGEVTDNIPKGVIVMWSGTKETIPTGWGLCDGTAGTPNLIDRFILGAETAGDTGGHNSLPLTADNIPSHTHTTGSHTHTFTGRTGNTPHGHGIASTSGGITQPTEAIPLYGVTSSYTTNTYKLLYNAVPTDTGSHSHSFSGTTAGASGTTGSTGMGTAIDNRPAYYALAFIIKL